MRDTVRRNDVHHWARHFLERLEATPVTRERHSLWDLRRRISRLAVRKPPKRW